MLLVKSENLPISIFKTIAPLPAAIASQPVSGELSGNLAINLNTFAVEGMAIPTCDRHIKGDSFVGQLGYANGGNSPAVSLLRRKSLRLAGGITKAQTVLNSKARSKSRKDSRKRLDYSCMNCKTSDEGCSPNLR